MEAHEWERGAVSLAMSIATLVIPISMIPAAKILAKKGPTKTALIGTIFLVLGLAIAGLAVGGIYDEMYPNPATTTLYVRGHRI